MKLIVFTIFCLVAFCSAAPVQDEELTEEEFVRGITDIIAGLVDKVVKPAVTNSLQGLAGLVAQITAGIAVDGLPAITGLIGKKSDEELTEEELVRGLSDIIAGLIDKVVKPAVTNSLQGLAGLVAQITAGIAVDGLPAITGLIGK